MLQSYLELKAQFTALSLDLPNISEEHLLQIIHLAQPLLTNSAVDTEGYNESWDLITDLMIRILNLADRARPHLPSIIHILLKLPRPFCLEEKNCIQRTFPAYINHVVDEDELITVINIALNKSFKDLNGNLLTLLPLISRIKWRIDAETVPFFLEHQPQNPDELRHFLAILLSYSFLIKVLYYSMTGSNLYSVLDDMGRVAPIRAR